MSNDNAGAAVHWAVLGTAGIAAHAFLPAVRALGDRAVAVGSRDPERAAEWAAEHQVDRAVGYDEALADPEVDAVYIAVPNDAHVEWANRAASNGRAVLCEKPIGLDAEEVDALLDQVGGALLWEAFVFPFHPQTELLRQLCSVDGPVGPAREIVSEFHFRVTRQDNIRWSTERGGGALLDVGCYPIRLARLLFDAEPHDAVARARTAASGVDAEIAGVVDFPDEHRLVFSAGLCRAPSTFTRIVGDTAELRVSNPFHPRGTDTVQLWQDGECTRTWAADPVPAFQWAALHVADVVRGRVSPRYLAADDSLANARALDLVRAAVTR